MELEDGDLEALSSFATQNDAVRDGADQILSRIEDERTGEIVLQDTAANLNKNSMVQKAYLGMQ